MPASTRAAAAAAEADVVAAAEAHREVRLTRTAAGALPLLAGLHSTSTVAGRAARRSRACSRLVSPCCRMRKPRATAPRQPGRAAGGTCPLMTCQLLANTDAEEALCQVLAPAFAREAPATLVPTAGSERQTKMQVDRVMRARNFGRRVVTCGHRPSMPPLPDTAREIDVMTSDTITPSPDEGRGQKSHRHVVFISHNHKDKKIAQIFANFLREIGDKQVEISFSDDPQFKGASFGESLTHEIASILQKTAVFFLIYTGRDRNYNWCMYEAGVATNPDSLQGTRIILVNFVDDEPGVFSGKRFVRARDPNQLKELIRDFCIKPDFFPGGLGPLFKDKDSENLVLSHALAKAEALHAELSSQPVGERREIARWPSITLTMTRPVTEEFLQLVEKNDTNLLSVFGANFQDVNITNELDYFLSHTILTESAEGGTKPFAFVLEGASATLRELRESWFARRKMMAIDEGIRIADNTPWDVVLAKEIYTICKKLTPLPDWSPFLDLESASKWLYPLVSTSFQNPNGSREFRIRIVPFLMPGTAVPGE